MVGSSHGLLFVNIIRSFSAGDLYMEVPQAVLEMLEEIHQNGGMRIIYKAKDKDDPFRLMGLAIECIKTLTC
jgi:citrate synthase